MSTNLIIEPRFRRLGSYIQDLERGLLQIPPFQRDKVWDNRKRKDLFDSLKNGYPIGSLLLWKPEDSTTFEKSLNKIGPYSVNVEDSQRYFYILDGFQRLATIFGCLIDHKKTELTVDENEWKKEFNICYDLKKEEFFIPRTNNQEIYQVQVYKLIDTRAAFMLEREFFKQEYYEKVIDIYMDRYRTLGTTLIDYVLPSTEIKGGEVEDAVEIFSRINSKGSIISTDWMVSALSYNKDQQGFKLSNLLDDLIENVKIYNFDKLKREHFLQCIINSFGKVHFDQITKKDTSKIEKLIKRSDFVEISKKSVKSIEKAIRFLFEELLVIEGKLLPYNNQLVFITDFFNQIENPTETQLKKLKNWFWITTYSNYFTMYSLSKQREAYHQFQKFLKDENENPVYNDKPDLPFEVAEFPKKIFFGSVRAKALLLFMLNYFNNFKTVNPEKINGFKFNYLFSDIKDDKGNFYPESVVTILDGLQFSKSKDMSFMLEDSEDYTKYFLTKEMKDIFLKKEGNYKEEILKIRKGIIIDNENQFIEKLGLRLTTEIG